MRLGKTEAEAEVEAGVGGGDCSEYVTKYIKERKGAHKVEASGSANILVEHPDESNISDLMQYMLIQKN